MKLTKSSIIIIATDIKKPLRLNLEKWRNFVISHKDFFLWEEDTSSGKETLQNIDLVDESFKGRVLYALNKRTCVAEYLKKKGYYAMSATFYEDNINEISIVFGRKPKLDDLRIFLEMAEYIDANLYVGSTKVTWEMLEE